MSIAKYKLLSKDESDDLNDNDFTYTSGKSPTKQRFKLWQVSCCLSACLNVALLVSIFILRGKSTDPPTPYAGLTLSKHGSWTFRSEYYSHNRTDSDAHWDAVDFNQGIVALTDQESDAMGLPRGERFPWDQSKGMYLINGYHNLHCLKMLWASLARWREGAAFGHLDWHSFHCVDSLRQDTLCDADDTPRFSGGTQPGSSTGAGQLKKCRDWGRLETWAKSRSACYRYLAHNVDNGLDRHKFCPEGSPYHERIEKLFGEGERERMIDRYGDIAPWDWRTGVDLRD